MNSENKDWKPKDGEMAWCMMGNECIEVLVVNYPYPSNDVPIRSRYGQRNVEAELLFPTAEAALQSIKVYDLEGKEVVIPRARVDLPDHTHLLNGIDKCHECGGESGDPGKIAKLEYSADMGYKPYRRDVDEKSWEEVIDFYIDWKNSNWLDLQRLYGFLNTQVDSLDRIRRYEELTRGYNQDRREGGC